MSCLSNLVLRSTVFAVFLFSISAGVSSADSVGESGFTSMFDGKSLDGWSVMPAEAAKA